ncbi:MAG: hypothetical protein Q4F21_13670 [Lachnospiraceae bacterium]|nr:hypothetical protein [Lachnospiraceae bacterium]
MSMFASCHDVREMKFAREVECPKCHERYGIEIFEKDGLTVGDSECDSCGYVIPEGVNFENYVRQLAE